MATTNAVKPTSKKAKASNYDAAQGKSSNYDATTSNVSNDATVQGRMEGLLSGNSKYMQLAEAKANEVSNKRGLLNSTMAVGAAQRANIESALPIARQDASTYDARERANQGYLNQASQFNAGADQEMTRANMNSQNQAGQFNAGADMQASEFNASQSNQMQQQQWSQDDAQAHDQQTQEAAQAHSRTMANLNADLEKGIIDQKSFANLRGQYLDSYASLVNETNINISEIQTSDAIPAEEKQKMINQQIAMRDADMAGMESLYKQQPMWQQNWANV